MVFFCDYSVTGRCCEALARFFLRFAALFLRRGINVHAEYFRAKSVSVSEKMYDC